jgi:hypothetical protein
MTFNDVHPAIREYFGYHELFRRLGFSPDELIPLVGPLEDGGPEDQLFFVLESQGKRFTAMCGQVKDFATFNADLAVFVDALQKKTISDADLKLMWEWSSCRANVVEILEAVRAKGFEISHGAEVLH